MPDHTAADQIIVLASLAGIGQRQVGSAGPEISNLAAQTEASNATCFPQSYIQAEAALEDSRSGRTSGVRAVINEILILSQVGEPATEAYPRRNPSCRKDVEPGGRGEEDLLVTGGNDIAAGAEILVHIEDSREFKR